MDDIIASRRGFIGYGAGAAMLAAWPAWGQALDPDEAAIDALVQSYLVKFGVPGIAVAIVRPGRPDFARGYGVRTLGKPGAIDAHTLFGIASNSKAFTAAALAILVDEGKVAWDESVVRYLPEFRMYDPAVTRMMTVRDLLVHRSGLALGAGDLMQFPATTHRLEGILHGLQYLKPERGFRTGYAYDNILYLVAGILITRITGQSWEDFVTARLLRPLGMDESVAARSRIRTANLAGRHARLGPPLRGMGPVRVVQPDEQDKIDAAGGINASAADIAHWFHAQLALGKLPDGKRLWSEAQARQMWAPQTITGSGTGPTTDQPQRAVLTAYALGWFVQDYRGRRLLSHSGGLTGQVTQQALLPEQGCAVAVYTTPKRARPRSACAMPSSIACSVRHRSTGWPGRRRASPVRKKRRWRPPVATNPGPRRALHRCRWRPMPAAIAIPGTAMWSSRSRARLLPSISPPRPHSAVRWNRGGRICFARISPSARARMR
jgi:CubicO group peptidase (beta-lactamase class C family)